MCQSVLMLPTCFQPHGSCSLPPHMVRPQPWGGWEVSMPTLMVAVYGRHAVAVVKYSFSIELWVPGAGRWGKLSMLVRWGWESPWCSPLENKLVRGRRRRRGIRGQPGGCWGVAWWSHAGGLADSGCWSDCHLRVAC